MEDIEDEFGGRTLRALVIDDRGPGMEIRAVPWTLASLTALVRASLVMVPRFTVEGRTFRAALAEAASTAGMKPTVFGPLKADGTRDVLWMGTAAVLGEGADGRPASLTDDDLTLLRRHAGLMRYVLRGTPTDLYALTDAAETPYPAPGPLTDLERWPRF